jgi:hypothetical protein
MKRNTLFAIVGAALIGIAVWAFFRPPEGRLPPGSSAEEKRIMREIDKANRCETAADCAQAAASVCPFGCYVHVHKDEVARIQAMLVAYQAAPGAQTCMYACIEYPGVDCVKGSCELKQ